MIYRNVINRLSNKKLAFLLVQQVNFTDYNEECEVEFEFIKTNGEVCSYGTMEDAVNACIAWLESEV